MTDSRVVNSTKYPYSTTVGLDQYPVAVDLPEETGDKRPQRDRRDVSRYVVNYYREDHWGDYRDNHRENYSDDHRDKRRDDDDGAVQR